MLGKYLPIISFFYSPAKASQQTWNTNWIHFNLFLVDAFPLFMTINKFLFSLSCRLCVYVSHFPSNTNLAWSFFQLSFHKSLQSHFLCSEMWCNTLPEPPEFHSFAGKARKMFSDARNFPVCRVTLMKKCAKNILNKIGALTCDEIRW